MATAHIYTVTGFDRYGRALFARTVEAWDAMDARLLCGAEMKQTPRGSALWAAATRLETKQERRRA